MGLDWNVMIADHCPSCGEPLLSATSSETISGCPRCGASLVPRDGRAVTVVTHAGQDLRSAADVELSTEFRREYEVGRLLGSGTMGAVFAGAKLSIGKAVAIKIFIADAGSGSAKRFLLEGRLLARISHPNVLRVIDIGETGGHPFLVTDLLDGGTLKERILKKKRLDVQQTVQVALDCLAGLGELHSHGIVHRDLKPENILFDESGRAVLTDLGIAKLLADSQHLTQAGDLVGTPRYVAPEQISGTAVPASDLYSLGLVIHEMLTGHPPFDAPTVAALLALQTRGRPPSLRAARPDVPEWLEALVERALAKRPDDRPESASLMAEQIRDRIAAHAGSPARLLAATPPRAQAPPPSSAAPVGRAATLAVVAAAGLAAVVLWPSSPRIDPSRPVATAEAPPIDPRPAGPGREGRDAAQTLIESLAASDDRFDVSSGALTRRLSRIEAAIEALRARGTEPSSRLDREGALVLCWIAAIDAASGTLLDASMRGKARAWHSRARRLEGERRAPASPRPSIRQEVTDVTQDLEALVDADTWGEVERHRLTRAVEEIERIGPSAKKGPRLGEFRRPGTLARWVYLAARLAASREAGTALGQDVTRRLTEWLDGLIGTCHSDGAYTELRVGLAHESVGVGVSDAACLEWVGRHLAASYREEIEDWVPSARLSGAVASFIATIDGPPQAAERFRQRFRDASGSCQTWRTATRYAGPLSSKLGPGRGRLVPLVGIAFADLAVRGLHRQAQARTVVDAAVGFLGSLLVFHPLRGRIELAQLAGLVPARLPADDPDLARLKKVARSALSDARDQPLSLDSRGRLCDAAATGLPETVRQLAPELGL